MPWRWELKIKPIKQLEVRENVTDQVVIGLRFVSDWSREWREFSGRCDWRIKSRYLACQKSAIFAGNQIRRDRRINSPNMSSAQETSWQLFDKVKQTIVICQWRA